MNASNNKEDLYKAHLSEISGVKFTTREIDIISCILHNRGSKKIAILLSISYKTVEAHIYNITAKICKNSRDDIIDFIEKSGKISYFRQYYDCLLIEDLFTRTLAKIAKNINKTRIIYTISAANFLNSNIDNNLVVTQKLKRLQNHLKLANVVLNIDTPGIVQYYLLKPNSQNLKDNDKDIVLLFDDVTELPKNEVEYLDFTVNKNYYFMVLELLKKIINDPNFLTIEKEFKTAYHTLFNSAIIINPSETINSDYSNEELAKEKKLWWLKNYSLKTSLSLPTITLALIMICSVFVIFYYISNQQIFVKAPIKHSNIIIPKESALLNRPSVLNTIKDNLKQQGQIQVLALVGAGGAGKTTIARQFANMYNNKVVWEINAETKKSLNESFLSLANSIAISEMDQKILISLQQIQNQQEQESKIITFIKGYLQLNPNWLLIYDNVENLTNIIKYFPCDPNSWGEGKVIITTRDSNIQNNKFVNHTIDIGMLNQEQKLSLFIKIMDNKNSFYSTEKIEDVKKFLNVIPPYPLDVSVAAYYLKVNNTSFEQYLANLNQYNIEFEKVQVNLLKDLGDYTNTRHNIITLALQNLTLLHKDFEDLLLFISLLDSQDIPRGLLDQYKESTIIDNFILNLKKYSLITKESSSALGTTFSIHRSVQAIILSYVTNKLNLMTNKKLCEISDSLETYMNKLLDKEECIKSIVLLNHYERFLSHEELLADTSIGSVSATLGGTYCCLGYHSSAVKQLLEKSLQNLAKYDNRPLRKLLLQ